MSESAPTLKLKLHPKVFRTVFQLYETGLFGLSLPDTIDRIVCRWILDNADTMEDFGVDLPRSDVPAENSKRGTI